MTDTAMTIDYTHWFIRARLKMRQLMLLVALGDAGNNHRAAQLLSMTQPAASKLLKDMEDVLEVSLFERLPRGMRATPAGEAMIRHARAALATLQQAHDEVMGLKAGELGQVHVGAITSPGLTLLPHAVARLKQQSPLLRVVVEMDTSDVLLERLTQGRLDIVVARLFERHDKSSLHWQPLSDEPVCAVVRPGHALLACGGLTLGDLGTAGWIVPPAGSVLRHRFELLFQQFGLPQPQNVVETGALLFVTRMLACSDMVAVMATDVARYYAAHGMLAVLPLTLPCAMDDFGLITRSDRVLSPGALQLLAALREAATTSYGSDSRA